MECLFSLFDHYPAIPAGIVVALLVVALLRRMGNRVDDALVLPAPGAALAETPDAWHYDLRLYWPFFALADLGLVVWFIPPGGSIGVLRPSG